MSLAALLVTYLLARRSVVYGIVSVMTTGYLYGVLRANLPEVGSYFVFDCSVVALYAAQIKLITEPFYSQDGQRLKHWVVFLILWPLALFFIPLQDPLIQLIGLRGNMFLLPFILIGARLKKEQIYDLGLALSALNVAAFAAGVMEYVFGVDRFFPRNDITEIIYRSNDVGSMDAYRIPSLFSQAHSYAAMMVISLPLIVGAWAQPHGRTRDRNLLMAGIVSAMMGVFMSAVRTHFIILLVLITVFTFSARLRPVYRVGWLLVLLIVGYVVTTHERMQRFTTLTDSQTLITRFSSSINADVMELMMKYPFGNGLGGGGTSIPYFLKDRVETPLAVESEIGRIHLETGFIGMSAWSLFVLWIFLRPRAHRRDRWVLGLRLAWFTCLTFFALSMIGNGLFTAIPSTVIFLMLLGWISTHHTGESDRHVDWVRPNATPSRKLRKPALIPELASRGTVQS